MISKRRLAIYKYYIEFINSGQCVIVAYQNAVSKYLSRSSFNKLLANCLIEE